MPFFINSQDMIDTYGSREMIQLTDRAIPKTGTVNETLMDANIDDAEAEIITQLGCCFSIADILAVYSDARWIPTINHWAKVVTRIHLYSSLERDDSQVTKAYADYKEEIEALCKCGILVDNEGTEIGAKSNFLFIEDAGNCCSTCHSSSCCCGYFKDHL